MKTKYMKKSIIIAALFCLGLLSSSAMAQIHQEGQAAVEVSAGFLDGIKLPGRDNFGIFGGLAYSRYRTRYTYWKAGIHLNQKYYTYNQTQVPLSQWLGEATYFTRAAGRVGRSWVLNVGGGVAGGYESLNQNRRTVEGASLMNRSNWVVGPTVAIECEYILSGQAVLVARAQEYYLFRSSIVPTRFNLGIGIKFFLLSDFANK
jgi:hypothetical protein